MSNYWKDRMARQQDILEKKAVLDAERQLAKYYQTAMKRIIKEFEAVYDKLLTTKEEDLVPADLYKLSRYWEMQGQLRNELEQLGFKEIAMLSDRFEKYWQTSYENAEKDINAIFASQGRPMPEPNMAFQTIAADTAKQMINSVWCADGKTWSDRIWGNNLSYLAETLNEELVHCVVTGKKTTELKKLLQHRFNVSFHRADTLVRTEIAHITTEAKAERYKEYGLEYYEILGREETTGCNHSIDCHKMDGKKFTYKEKVVGVNAPPFHPNCRCTIIPVVE